MITTEPSIEWAVNTHFLKYLLFLHPETGEDSIIGPSWVQKEKGLSPILVQPVSLPACFHPQFPGSGPGTAS